MDFISMLFGSKKSKPDFKTFVGIYKDKLIYKDVKGRYYISSGRNYYLKKGTRISKTKLKQTPNRKASPKRKKRKDKSKYKPVKTNKNNVLGKRLSARHVYDTKGKKALGKKFKILQPDGSIKTKILRLRKN